jgi:hypothetical protein
MDTISGSNEKLITIMRDLLHTDEDLDFLRRLDKEDMERLVAVTRARTVR